MKKNKLNTLFLFYFNQIKIINKVEQIIPENLMLIIFNFKQRKTRDKIFT
jgi:hypothetical protein